MTDFTDLVDLAAEALGGTVVAANDEFFAPKEALLKPTPAEWREGVYTERGKWMDGWETRRRRTPGYDWAIIRLGVPGKIRGVVIDTSFFRGNFPERASIEGCALSGPTSLAELEHAEWRTLLPESPLAGDKQNRFEIHDGEPVGHIRLNIFPDGGVARLRVHGDVVPVAKATDTQSLVDFAAIEHGGFSVMCSDMFFGHRQNLIMPGRSTHMGNGWETKRRRGPGHDWTIIRLGHACEVHRIELDTDHYKGNAPDSCMIEGALLPDELGDYLSDPRVHWTTLVEQAKLQPHSRHEFTPKKASVTHVRLNIYPDGGVARFRVFGRRVWLQRGGAIDIHTFNRMKDGEAAQLLAACCGSSRWVASMLAHRPFEDLEDLLMASNEAAESLEAQDWLEAFRHHPRIGERSAQTSVSSAAAAWSEGEQAAASESSDDIQARIAEGNREYEKRFGFIFIIRAAGRTADEVLASLEERLGNDADAELAIAAREQQQITNLRLMKLIQGEE
jgi:allantoicase